MRDRSDRYQVSPIQSISQPKPLGGYLLEAGLITPDQVSVALNDQKATGMRFGEVLVARGWLKEQTVEWIMQKVIVPEKTAHQHSAPNSTHVQEITVNQSARPAAAAAARPAAQPVTQGMTQSRVDKPGASSTINTAFVRRESPIAKPLSTVKDADEDVNWVG